jgi:hypothetical protein
MMIPASDPRTHARCNCGAEYDFLRWSGLSVLARVDDEQLRTLVTAWDRSRCVEVRRCAQCGAAIAKLVRVPEGMANGGPDR